MRAILASAVAAAVVACGPPPNVVGDGSLVKVTRQVPGVFAVRLELPAALEVVQGPTSTLLVEGEENLLPHVSATLEAGELTLGVEPDVALTPTRPLRVVVTAPTFRAITSASVGNITATALTVPALTLEVANRGGILVERLEADRLDVTLVSLGDVRVDSGKVNHLEAQLKNRGDLVTTGLEATTAGLTLSRSGSAWVWVTDALGVTIGSSGDVRYLGAPTLTTFVSGTGTVEPLVVAVP